MSGVTGPHGRSWVCYAIDSIISVKVIVNVGHKYNHAHAHGKHNGAH